jgi:hypothetical protein
MSELTGYTIFGASMIVIGAAFYAILVSAWRMMHDDGELRLARMLKRHGGRLDLAMGGFNTYQGALAVRRCVACPDKTECDAGWPPASAMGRRRSARTRTLCSASRARLDPHQAGSLTGAAGAARVGPPTTTCGGPTHASYPI